jgi:hypothetical protein
LLHDVFGIVAVACEAEYNGENPFPVTLDENFKCLSISTFRGKDEHRFFVLACDVL